MKRVQRYLPSLWGAAITSALLLLAIVLLMYWSPDKVHTDLNSQANLNDAGAVSFEHQVQPLLNKRCVVCHSCYDAPCQLKLSSVEGIERGANEALVYEPKRLKAMDPSRLFIDAKSNKEWRAKGFQSVIESPADDAGAYNKSLMQLVLNLKKIHPQPSQGKLPKDFTLELDREQACPSREDFAQYAEEHPLWGMPYALPNLSDAEHNIFTRWLDNGAVMPKVSASSYEASQQVKAWEEFLNGASNKQKLASRYIYEHLFQGRIHFKNTPADEFYRLVRSLSPTAQPIDEIASIRPYDDPNTEQFYYRLRPYTPTIVAKNHSVYEFSDARMQRYRELFINADYKVEKLPSYDVNITANPFKVFAAIPPTLRYRFLLDDARFFIEGFIKGPVCRGQVALNVIEDQFWVMFFNPDEPIFTTQASFLNNMSDYLSIPSERGSHLNLLPIWTDYWRRQKHYMLQKQAYFEKMNTQDLHYALNYVWDGDGKNPNSALTVFRHFDSASVEYGFVGQQPETAWILDYPLLERIHYLLVAGYNVYGNVVHQLSTRIYMDFLRMEGEDHFLSFLPVNQRKKIRDEWYKGIRAELDVLFDAPMDWLNVESVIGYQTDDVQTELFQHLRKRLANVLQQGDDINLCGRSPCLPITDKSIQQKINQKISVIETMKGKPSHAFPEVSFVRIVTDDNNTSYAYSILRNAAYDNVISLLSDERQRDKLDIEKDTMTVVNWLLGSYPNFFFTVQLNDLDEFISHFTHAGNQKNFERLIERFGVRRTHPDFWETADWFQLQYARQRPLYSGLYDLSRYDNL